MATLSEALSAYRICVQAEGKSPQTIRWTTSSVTYFSQFLGPKQKISSITANDFRRFIIALTRLQLTELLLDHYPDEKQEALEHLDFSINEFREMKMQPSMGRALKQKEILGT